MGWMTVHHARSGRLRAVAGSAAPMYPAAANVNEARKALWSKTFRAFGHVKGSAVIIVSSEEFYDKRPFIILKPQPANVNEARKALWSKTFRAFGHVKGSAVIIVSSEEFYDKRPFIILKPQLIKREITY